MRPAHERHPFDQNRAIKIETADTPVNGVPAVENGSVDW